MTESAHAEAFARLRSKKGQAGVWAQQQSTYFEPFSIASSHRCYQLRVKHQGELSGFGNKWNFKPLSVSPYGYKKGLSRYPQPLHQSEDQRKYDASRTSRQRRGASNPVGLLAPHLRQGGALHPGRAGFQILGLKSALPVAVGRGRPRTHSRPCNGLSLLHGAAYGSTLRVRVINGGMVPSYRRYTSVIDGRKWPISWLTTRRASSRGL